MPLDKEPQVFFVLVQPRNPINIGSVARAMANFGFSDLRVVDPYEPVWKETKSAVGAEKIIQRAKRFDRLAEAIGDAQTVIGTTAGKNRVPRVPVQWANDPWPNKGGLGPWAFVFGSEKSGLSNEDLEQCHAVFQIPTHPDCPSMNLSHAASVSAFWARWISGWDKASTQSASREKLRRISASEETRLVETAVESVQGTKSFSRWPVSVLQKKWTASIKRMRPSAEDAALLHGLFRTIKRQAQK